MQIHNGDDGEMPLCFSKWHRKDKRKFVERFCTVGIPDNQNGKTKNLQITCNLCGKVFMGQLLTAIVHLSGVTKGGQRMSTCPLTNENIKAEVLSVFVGEEEGGQEPQRNRSKKSKANKSTGSVLTKRKLDIATDTENINQKTLMVNPFNPVDMAVLRFFTESGLSAEFIESDAFVIMAQELRGAPDAYHLPSVVLAGALDTGEHGGVGSAGGGGHSSNSSNTEGQVVLHHTQMQQLQHHHLQQQHQQHDHTLPTGQQQQQHQQQQLHLPLQHDHLPSPPQQQPQHTTELSSSSSLPVSEYGALSTENPIADAHNDEGEGSVGSAGTMEQL